MFQDVELVLQDVELMFQDVEDKIPSSEKTFSPPFQQKFIPACSKTDQAGMKTKTTLIHKIYRLRTGRTLTPISRLPIPYTPRSSAF